MTASSTPFFNSLSGASADPEGLDRTIRPERITMRGVIPATVMLFAALSLGDREARLIKYATSGDVSGDYGWVAGYAGMAVL